MGESDTTASTPLPSGTITFLFSDIEGSTRLAGAVPDRWPALLGRHREILRAAFGAHQGVEVNTEGDGSFVAFGDASDAVRAAIDAQLALHAERWPPDTPIRVRMGIYESEFAMVGGAPARRPR